MDKVSFYLLFSISSAYAIISFSSSNEESVTLVAFLEQGFPRFIAFLLKTRSSGNGSKSSEEAMDVEELMDVKLEAQLLLLMPDE